MRNETGVEGVFAIGGGAFIGKLKDFKICRTIWDGNETTFLNLGLFTPVVPADDAVRRSPPVYDREKI
jgi:hypothetical protein